MLGLSIDASVWKAISCLDWFAWIISITIVNGTWPVLFIGSIIQINFQGTAQKFGHKNTYSVLFLVTSK